MVKKVDLTVLFPGSIDWGGFCGVLEAFFLKKVLILDLWGRILQ